MDNGTPSQQDYYDCVHLLLTGMIMIMQKLENLGDHPTPEESEHFMKCFEACMNIGLDPSAVMTRQ